MLPAADVSALVAARHGDPFAVLGLQADNAGRLWLRAMLPGATSVAVVDASTGKRIAVLTLRDAGGLWEAAIPRRKKRFAYRLQVQWAAGR
jgi:1,4-alpha-glucan branching enzyme